MQNQEVCMRQWLLLPAQHNIASYIIVPGTMFMNHPGFDCCQMKPNSCASNSAVRLGRIWAYQHDLPSQNASKTKEAEHQSDADTEATVIMFVVIILPFSIS